MNTGLTSTHTACSLFCMTSFLQNNAFSVLHYVIYVALHYTICYIDSKFFLPPELSRTAGNEDENCYDQGCNDIGVVIATK